MGRRKSKPPAGYPFADIGRRLALVRDALKIDQTELCRQIKIKTNRWNQYETGERKITQEVASKLWRSYRITYEWIYENDPSHLPSDIRATVLQKIAA